MPYDPAFLPGFDVPLPTLGARARQTAHAGGAPVDHTRFSLIFDVERGLARVTAHNIDGGSLLPEGAIDRRDRFRLDPDVPAALQVDDARGYRKNPFDRGHLVRRRAPHWGDRREAARADLESFFWTNIAPQHETLHDSASQAADRVPTPPRLALSPRTSSTKLVVRPVQLRFVSSSATDNPRRGDARTLSAACRVRSRTGCSP